MAFVSAIQGPRSVPGMQTVVWEMTKCTMVGTRGKVTLCLTIASIFLVLVASWVQ